MSKKRASLELYENVTEQEWTGREWERAPLSAAGTQSLRCPEPAAGELQAGLSPDVLAGNSRSCPRLPQAQRLQKPLALHQGGRGQPRVLGRARQAGPPINTISTRRASSSYAVRLPGHLTRQPGRAQW